jgi:hypothetical protein
VDAINQSGPGNAGAVEAGREDKMSEASLAELGLRPHSVDKLGPKYLKSDVEQWTMKMICSQYFFNRVAKEMTTDAQLAIETTNEVTAELSKSLYRFQEVRADFVSKSKKASGDIRDATNKLAEGLTRIEKTANFDRLERYVLLLERAAAAMNSLAELEQSGKLEKIAGALK